MYYKRNLVITFSTRLLSFAFPPFSKCAVYVCELTADEKTGGNKKASF